MKSQYPVLAWVLVVAMSGCLTAQEPEPVEVSAELDSYFVERIQEVSGIVRITNPNDAAVDVAGRHEPISSVLQTDTMEQILPTCRSAVDYPNGPPKTRIGPGESVTRSFSLWCWEEIDQEFPDGRYGLNVDAVYGPETYEQVFFHIDSQNATD